MSPARQFIVLYDQSSKRARYVLRFAAPSEESTVEVADVRIETGDGKSVQGGTIQTPSVLEWRGRDEQEVGAHTYHG